MSIFLSTFHMKEIRSHDSTYWQRNCNQAMASYNQFKFKYYLMHWKQVLWNPTADWSISHFTGVLRNIWPLPLVILVLFLWQNTAFNLYTALHNAILLLCNWFSFLPSAFFFFKQCEVFLRMQTNKKTLMLFQHIFAVISQWLTEDSQWKSQAKC